MSRLIIFLALYFCIYGAVHLYLLIKWRRAFYLQGVGYVLLSVILIFLILAPVNARLLEAQGYGPPAVVLTWIGMLWMGFVFIYICLALPLDGYHLLVGAGQRLSGTDWTAMMLSRRQSVLLVVVVSLCLMTYGAVEAYRVCIETVTLRSAKLPSGAGAVRIVQVSDLHLGPMLYPGRMDPVIKILEQVQPDILVCTGDMIDGRLFNAAAVAARLRSVKAPLGKFAVTGNHEHYLDQDRAAAFIRDAGFILLKDQIVSVGGHVAIAGVQDPAAGDFKESSEAALLKAHNDDRFLLLLKHRPFVCTEAAEQIDLQLSGHTHKGQIFPFGLLVDLFYSIGSGLQAIGDRGHVYVSRGTGTWGPPVRILARPEITVFDVLPE